MMITELKSHQHAIYGAMPADMWFGTNAIDGDAAPFTLAPVGQVYVLKDLTNNLMQVFIKRQHVPHDHDWGPIGGLGVICETVTLADFTDGGATTGTYVMKQTIPVNAVVLKSTVSVESGFIGDTTATLQIGDGTDADRYSTGTPSVFTTDTAVDVGATSGTAWHDAAKSVTLTVTSGSDFAAVTAGTMTVKIFYYA
jgi:hypothetical protein